MGWKQEWRKIGREKYSRKWHFPLKSEKNIWTKLPSPLINVSSFFSFFFSFFFFDFSFCSFFFFSLLFLCNVGFLFFVFCFLFFSLVLLGGGFFFFSFFFFFLIFIFIFIFKKTLLDDFLCYFLKCPLSSIHNFLKMYNVLLFVLFKRNMMVNLYKLYFQPNQKVFHPFTFPPSQPNTNEKN